MAAGVRAGSRSGAVLLTDPDALGHSAKEVLDLREPLISTVVLMGPESSLGTGVETDLDFEPPASGSITGTVTGPDGTTPLENVRVVAHGWDEDSTDYPVYHAHEASTVADGSYLIDHLEAGRYWLTFTDPDGTYAAESYPTAPSTGGHGDLVSVMASPAPPAHLDESLMTTAAWAAQRVTRLAGNDRFATAIAMSQASYRSADTVVIVSGEGFADALSAAAVAGAYRAPLLLTRRDTLPAGLVSELHRLGTERVLIVGGTGAVSVAVEQALTGAGVHVESRISGADRYATSAAAYRHLRTTSGLPTVAPAPFVVRGDAYPDAIAASPFAYRQIRPILLVRPTAAPDAITELFAEYGIPSAIVVGGTGAVSDGVVAELGTAGTGTLDAVRLQGLDRYATAAAVARHWGRPYDFIGIASGRNYPDALVGGVLAGARGGALLLTPGDALSPASESVLAENAGDLQQVRTFGGTGAVNAAVQAEIAATVGP